MIANISYLVIGAAIVLSCFATAIYCRRRMDIRNRLLHSEITRELEKLRAAAILSANDFETRFETQSQTTTELQSAQKQSAETLNEVDTRLQTLFEEEPDRESKLVQKAVAEAHTEMSAAIAQTTSAAQKSILAVATNLERTETKSNDHSQQLTQLGETLSESVNTITAVNSELSRLRAFAEAANSNANDTAAQLGRLRIDIESNFNAERLGDVEQLAIVAANMAGDGLAKLDVTTPSSISPMLHGHSMMMYQMLMDASAQQTPAAQNGVHLLEIGTTREKWWSQMSTSRLAATCRTLNYRMMTVDVDERNTASGLSANRYYSGTVSAETALGEEFVENWEGELPPYIYIDAYDYEHGQHSKDRQERYVKLQGEEISNEACWEMHYKCAVEFVKKCPDNGIVVFDDVFLEDGEWLGKGQTAVPYMLKNGFELVAQSPQTSVFKKRPPE